MSRTRWIILALLVLVFLTLTPTIINIYQNGPRERDGRTPAEILGVAHVDEAMFKHVLALEKADVFQLFYALPAPSFAEMQGEYYGKLVDAGILAPATSYYTNHVFGPGRWLGKGIALPAATYGAALRGKGYNLFLQRDADGRPESVPAREFDTYLGPSQIDPEGGPAYHLNYEAYNGGTVDSMRDELRKVNDDLYLGMGHMALGGGAINPAPFLLMKAPEESDFKVVPR